MTEAILNRLTNILIMLDVFDKIESVLESCQTLGQVDSVENMIKTFDNRFKHEEHYLTLSVLILYRKLKKKREHLINKDNHD